MARFSSALRPILKLGLAAVAVVLEVQFPQLATADREDQASQDPSELQLKSSPNTVLAQEQPTVKTA